MKTGSIGKASGKQHRRLLFISNSLYLVLSVLLFYLLSTSRSEEVYAVREVMPPLFLPIFFSATILLLAIILSSERTEFKLLLVITHSLLSHAFFVIAFPAGNVGAQQLILGRTRLVYDNVTFHGNWWPTENVLLQVYRWSRGDNFQAALSVVLARMLNVDVYWTHLLLVPFLWGTFVPIVTFMIAKTLGASKNISVLSSLVVSLFSTTILWGAVSIPNGLSYLFFFCFVYFLLKYLRSNKARDLLLVWVFLMTSFLSHFLPGTIAFSLLILASGFKANGKGKTKSTANGRFRMLLSFILSASILPFALTYRRFFFPTSTTHFGLEKLTGLSPFDIVLSLFLGSYYELMSRGAIITTLILGLAPLLGVIGMIYVLRLRSGKAFDRHSRLFTHFIFLAFLLIVIDDRIVKFLMIAVPFVEVDRLWVLRDFLLTPFLAILIVGIMSNIDESQLKKFLKALPTSIARHSSKYVDFLSVFARVSILIVISGWITASIYYAYPQWSPLQTTPYEIEAVKYIDETTKENYVVIGDQWIIFAGQMFVGINNPRAFYFSHVDARGVALFIEMRNNPTNETLIQAMEYNNATVAYFIIELPRMGTDLYNRTVQQAQQNYLQTYEAFYYKGEEKLRIFYYEKI